MLQHLAPSGDCVSLRDTKEHADQVPFIGLWSHYSTGN
jgi:hypothetical protein